MILNLVTIIGKYVFSYCCELEKVTFGENLIDDSAFQNCTNQNCIYFYRVTSPAFGVNVFLSVLATTVLTFETYE